MNCTRQRKPAEIGIPLRGPGMIDKRDALRLAEYARGLLRRGAEPMLVAVETGIRLNTLHMMLSRMRVAGRQPRASRRTANLMRKD
ncbi:hypothetical protein MVI01_71680 [Myxococcus virescens]|uniref:Uncharacterized protein n=1 Tax=Myxococcus virescens TaxID=83456 RepID=A0A511HPT0_9BACT|nr:hypothetical protein MVI01_71680 [Myxococcus virescens]SDE65652.1 hypothetical protein SAMN04488504_109298 [Myxococcus virescens]